MGENNNLIYLSDYEKQREIYAYMNLMRQGSIMEIININEDGEVDLYEFSIHKLGLEFGFDFVTIEDKPQIYPIDLEIGNGEIDFDTLPGIYITELDKVDLKDSKMYEFVENNIDLLRKIEKMYFEKFLPNDKISYSKNVKKLYKEDREFVKKQPCKIYDFNKCKKAIAIERVKRLVKKPK